MTFTSIVLEEFDRNREANVNALKQYAAGDVSSIPRIVELIIQWVGIETAMFWLVEDV